MMDLIGLAVLALVVLWIAGGALWVIGKGIETGANLYRHETRDRSLDPYKARIVRDASQWDDGYSDD